MHEKYPNSLIDLDAFREARKLDVQSEAAILTQAFNISVWPAVQLSKAEEKQRDNLMKEFGSAFCRGSGSAVMLLNTDKPESCAYTANTIMDVLNFWGINSPGVQKDGITSYSLGEVRKTRIPVRADSVRTVIADMAIEDEELPTPGDFITINYRRHNQNVLVYLTIPASPECL